MVLLGLDPTRRPTHIITTFTGNTHAIRHAQTPKHSTASPLPCYHKSQSTLSITTPSYMRTTTPQACSKTTLTHTKLGRRNTYPVNYATHEINITLGLPDITHTIANIQIQPHYPQTEIKDIQTGRIPTQSPNQSTLVKLKHQKNVITT